MKAHLNCMLKLSIIIVNYNTEQLLDQCLKSLSDSHIIVPYEIRVVDNNSTDDSVDLVKRKYASVTLIENNFNSGFASANNQAIKSSRGEYILLLNPDTLVLPDTIESLIQVLDQRSQIGIIGPRLLNADKTLQNSHGEIATLKSEIVRAFSLERLLFWHRRKTQPEEIIYPDKSSKMGWLSGACFLIRRKTIEDIGLMDEAFFFSCEDADWSLRAQKRGWKICYYPKVAVIHYGEQSSGKDRSNLVIYRYQSKVRFFRKHLPPEKFALWRNLVLTELSLRIAATWLSLPFLLFRGKVGSVISKIKAYSNIFRSLAFDRQIFRRSHN